MNQQAITVAGANIHEMHPTKGKAITEEDMLLDIKRLMLATEMAEIGAKGSNTISQVLRMC